MRIINKILFAVSQFVTTIYKGFIWIVSRKISISLLHSLFILVLTYFWLNQPIAHDSEEKLITNFSNIKHELLSNNLNNIYTDSLICINTSRSIMVVDRARDFGDIAIADRNELAYLFETISRYNNHKYILCDVMFEETSAVDDRLKDALITTKRIIVPEYLYNGSIIKPIFSINSAMVQYHSNVYSNQFSKFRVILSDNLKTIPLGMYNEIDQKEIIRRGWFYFDEGKQLCLNSNFIDFRIKNVRRTNTKGLMGNSSNKTVLNYYELTNFNSLNKYRTPSEISELLKDKTILIGSFEGDDIHNTIYGRIPGILIIYNTYLNLKEGFHIIPISLILILLSIFFTLSYRIFYSIPIKINFLNKVNKSSAWVLISTLLSYTVLFGIISILTYFIFGILINIYLIAFYFSALDLGIKYIKKRRKTIK